MFPFLPLLHMWNLELWQPFYDHEGPTLKTKNQHAVIGKAEIWKVIKSSMALMSWIIIINLPELTNPGTP